MAIDPRNYDLDELRSASVGHPPIGGRDAGSGPGVDADEVTTGSSEDDGADPDRPPAAVAFETAVARDLAALDGDDVERPYLPALPASLPAEALLFEWLEFLVLQGGRESAADAFEFYERIGWLGSEAAESLDAYLSGVTVARATEGTDLTPDDHRVSLHYVARLASFSQR